MKELTTPDVRRYDNVPKAACPYCKTALPFTGGTAAVKCEECRQTIITSDSGFVTPGSVFIPSEQEGE